MALTLRARTRPRKWKKTSCRFELTAALGRAHLVARGWGPRLSDPMGLLVLAPLQVTATLPVPGCFDGPISHVQDTVPSASAVLGVRPCAVDLDPAGVWCVIEQDAPGVVWTPTVARPPGLGPETEVISTPFAGAGCGASAAVGAGATRVVVGCPR